MGISLGGGRRRRRRSYADYKPPKRDTRPRSDPFRVIFYLVLIGAGVWLYLRRDQVRAELLSQVEEASAAVITLTPTPLPDDFARQGELAYQNGSLEEAIEFYRQASEYAPNAVEYHAQVARLLIFLSATQYDATRQATLEQALEAADRAVLAGPESPQGYAIRSMALDWNGRPDQASSEALRSLEFDPNYAVAHAYLAEALVDLDRWDQALGEAETAISLAPDSVDVRRNYAYVLESLGDYAGAAAQYEQAVALHPRLTFLYLALGRTYRALGRHDEAIEQFFQAEQLDPQNPIPSIEIGWTYQAFIGDEAPALEYFERAIELDDTYTRAWVRIGTLRYGQGSYPQAALAFERALELGVDDVEVYYQLGLSYANGGECTDAIRYLTQAREAAAGDERIEAIIEGGFELCAVPIPTLTPTPTTAP